MSVDELVLCEMDEDHHYCLGKSLIHLGRRIRARRISLYTCRVGKYLVCVDWRYLFKTVHIRLNSRIGAIDAHRSLKAWLDALSACLCSDKAHSAALTQMSTQWDFETLL